METLYVKDLDNAIAEIQGFALGLFYDHVGETVTLQVCYPEGDQDRGGAWSSPDTLTVDRQLQVIEATAE